MASLLSSFKNDFNRTISVYPRVEQQDPTNWEMVMTWPTATATGVKCLLLLRGDQGSMKYNQYINNQVEYIKTTHKIRLDFGPTINAWDKITDNTGVTYVAKLVLSTPWFDGVDDHLLVLCDVMV